MAEHNEWIPTEFSSALTAVLRVQLGISQINAYFDEEEKALRKINENVEIFTHRLLEVQRQQRNKIRRSDIVLSQTYIGPVDLRISIDAQWPMRLEWPG